MQLEMQEALRASTRGALSRLQPEGAASSALAANVSPRQVWNLLAQQGLLDIGSDAEFGGMTAATIVSQELGRASIHVPFADTVLFNLIVKNGRKPSEVGASQFANLSPGAIRVILCHLGDGAEEAIAEHKIKRARFEGVASAADATHFLIYGFSSGRYGLVDATTPGVTVENIENSFGGDSRNVNFENVNFEALSGNGFDVGEIRAVRRLLITASAVGAAARALDIVLDYVKTRRQFGALIGSYQSMQHRLVNCLLGIKAASLAVDEAARDFDESGKNWLFRTQTGFAFASSTLRQISIDIHHSFGATSYWDSHEMPRHFMRIHSDLLREGGLYQARRDVAVMLLDREKYGSPSLREAAVHE